MPRYRVRAEHTIGHHGVVLQAGDELELPLAVAGESNIRGRIEPVPDRVAEPAPAEPLTRLEPRGAVSDGYHEEN